MAAIPFEWIQLLCAFAIGLVIVYAPGYILARSVPFGRFSAAVIAPAFSSVSLIAFGIALERLGISCPAYVFFLVVLTFCAAVFGICTAYRDKFSNNKTSNHELLDSFQGVSIRKYAIFAILISLIIGWSVFMSAIGDPNAFSRHDDSTVHLSSVRGFLDTGTYSTLHVGAYIAQGLSSAFYPSEWYLFNAILASVLQANIAMASNALILVFVCVVFPLAILLLLTKLIPNDHLAWYCGALISTGFSGFPWGFIVFGQLLPNMLSFMYAPMFLAVLIAALEPETKATRAKLLITLFVGYIAIAFAQPNGVFTFSIWAGAYCASRLLYRPNSARATLNAKRAIALFLLLAIGAALWIAAYRAPFMQQVVQFTWKPLMSPIKAAVSGLLFMFIDREGIHPMLTVMLLAGLLFTIRHRRYLWLTVCYCFALALYVTSIATEGPLKQLLTGFWYTDYTRTGAMTTLFAIPLAAFGFAQIVHLSRAACRKLSKTQLSSQWGADIPTAILVALLLTFQFAAFTVPLGKTDVRLGMVRIQEVLSGYYNPDYGLSRKECKFLDDAQALIKPNDAIVFNIPFDGSCWAYFRNDMNVFFRRGHVDGLERPEQTELLRTSLCDISRNEEVAAKVEELGVRYVLKLDSPPSKNSTLLSYRYVASDWTGVDSIDSTTPGFKLLLQSGDMALYEIMGPDYDSNTDTPPN